MKDDSGQSWIRCVCVYVYLGGNFCDFTSLYCSHGAPLTSCWIMWMSAEAAAIRSAGLREGSDDQVVLIKHRLSAAGLGSRTFVTSPDRLDGALEKPFWGSTVETGIYSTSSGFPADLLWKFSCFLLLHICARVFKKIHHLLMPNSIIFLNTLIRGWLRKPKLAKKRKDLQESKWGLMEGTYGNYTLIYHLGHGN